MASKIVALRADDAEIDAWKAAAGSQGLPFNRWARAALNDQRELDVSLARMEEREAGEDA